MNIKDSNNRYISRSVDWENLISDEIVPRPKHKHEDIDW